MNLSGDTDGAPLGPLWQIRRVLRRHGLLGTARLAWQKTIGRILSHDSLRRFREHERRFDRTYNIDTAGFVRPYALDVRSPEVKFASPYSGIDPPMFESLLRSLDIDYRQFTFIDFGSGKGRAVLLASKLTFRKVIGIELSPSLHEISCGNAHRFPADIRHCDDIEFLCRDAARYDLPAGDLVLFFYNPFERNIFDLVVANIETSMARDPRTIYLVLANVPFPVQPAGFDALPFSVPGPMPGTVLRSSPGGQPQPSGATHHA
jgi:SAM-dependent methyltransferase